MSFASGSSWCRAVLATIACPSVLAVVLTGCGSAVEGGRDASPSGLDSGGVGSGVDATTIQGGGLLSGPDGGPSGDSSGDVGSSSRGGGADGGATCQAYQTACGGGCIATSVDPSNCGGCGVTCAAPEVCSSGACSDAGCLSGLSACSGSCVDLNNDSTNCGTCSHACATGTGCAGGTCVPSAPLDFDAGALDCNGGGPAIDVELDGGLSCTGNLAQVSFRWALCSCTDLDISAPLTTDGYDSTKGPPDGGLGGNVGCDLAAVNWSQSVQVGGDLWAADAGTFMPSGPGSEIRQDLHLGGTISASSPFTIDGNAYVVGSVSGATVEGTTSHPASIPPPCDCAPSQLVPVGDIVAAYRAPNNDDSAIGLDPNIVGDDAGVGPLRIDLPCGNYYLTSVRNANPLTIYAHGHVGLYIDGDVGGSAPLAFTLDPTATLDIFVSGTINTSQMLTIGSPNYPSLCRLYVGGTATLAFSQNANVACNFYAANSQLVDWSATSAIYGSVFAGDFKASHNTFIHYDDSVLRAGTECPLSPGGPDAGEGSLDAGGSPGGPTCNSCRDCNNQACVNGTCGACSSNSDCCAPLQCFSGVCGLAVAVPR